MNCQVCNTNVTSRWYAGPTCNKCYCKRRRSDKNFLIKEKAYNSLKSTKARKNYWQKQFYKANIEYYKGLRSSPEYKMKEKIWRREYRKTSKYLDYQKAYRKSNKYKTSNNTRRRNNYAEDPGVYKEYVAARRAGLNRATPSWVDREAIKAIYKNCPKGMEVDHIIPLKHELMCGLHVPWNLQYLTISQNRSKKNKVY